MYFRIYMHIVSSSILCVCMNVWTYEYQQVPLHYNKVWIYKPKIRRNLGQKKKKKSEPPAPWITESSSPFTYYIWVSSLYVYYLSANAVLLLVVAPELHI